MDTVTIQTHDDEFYYKRLIEAYSPDLYQQPTPWYGCVVSHELYAQIQEVIPTQRRDVTDIYPALIPHLFGIHIIAHPLERGAFNCRTARDMADRLHYLDELKGAER